MRTAIINCLLKLINGKSFKEIVYFGNILDNLMFDVKKESSLQLVCGDDSFLNEAIFKFFKNQDLFNEKRMFFKREEFSHLETFVYDDLDFVSMLIIIRENYKLFLNENLHYKRLKANLWENLLSLIRYMNIKLKTLVLLYDEMIKTYYLNSIKNSILFH